MSEVFATLRGESSGQAPTTVRIKPTVRLPGDDVSISDAAEKLGKLLRDAGRTNRRGNAPVQVANDDDGERVIHPLKPAHLPSLAESVALLVKVRHTPDGDVQAPTVMQEQTAKLILASDPFINQLDPIRILSRCPVLVERGGELVEITGYDRASGVLASGGALPTITINKAVELLTGVLVDFKFASEGDKSRAIAAMVTPALVHGGLLGGRSPVDLSEADKSQTGKGYRNKLTTAIYRHCVATIAQRKGGVGSLEEAFNSALVRGANFIALDNVRGRIDSPAIESFLTEDRYAARIPYSGDIEIDPRRVVVMLTSNRAEITRDLANRASCSRIIKQDAGYQFAKFPEGDILDHVRANQPLYLAAVFKVVREWHQHGKPRTAETRHDFRRWAQALDWIVQSIFRCAPLLDGHDSARDRMTNPTLNWLRDVALLVIQAGRTDEFLRAHELLDILRDAGDVEIPGTADGTDLDEDQNRLKAMQGIGAKLGRCFAGKAEVEIDGVTVARQQVFDTDGRPRNEHRFSCSFPQSPTSPDYTPDLKPAFPRSPRTETQHLLNGEAEDSPIKSLKAFGEVGGDSGKPLEGDGWTF